MDFGLELFAEAGFAGCIREEPGLTFGESSRPAEGGHGHHSGRQDFPGLMQPIEESDGLQGMWSKNLVRDARAPELSTGALEGRWHTLSYHAIWPILFSMDTDDRSTTSMNISLPKSLRSFVEECVSSSSYTSASEYLRELIRKDREHRVAKDRLEDLLLEGLVSGPADPFEDEFFEKLKERVRSARASENESP
jgi:antitoxin ParD1/3/4